MNRTKVLQEIRKMRFEELYELWTESRLTEAEAALQLGMHERTFRRWCRRFEAKGAEGLIDQRLERAAHNTAPVDEVMSILSLFETHYPHFNVSHFYDKYRQAHQGERCYSWVKNRLQEAGLVKSAKRRGAHRRKRPRQPMKGMMIHQDGSTHEWVPGQMWDLIVTLDDADSEIYSAFFVEQEGTFSSFQGVREVVEQHGLFCSFYSDRGSHYWTTPKVGEKVDKQNLTQFGRAMQQLGIEMIPAYSPEARGRSERMFRTLQERLPKELAMAEINEMSAANDFLKKTFLPQFNQRFRVKPADELLAFVPWVTTQIKLDDILCLHDTRQVNKDNTISYKGKLFQIPKQTFRYSMAKSKVKVHEYIDGSIAIFHGPRELVRYRAEGLSKKEDKKYSEAA